MNTVALIPARGKSKRLPRKNILPLAGKPLLAHSIEQARCSRSVDRVVVTTDDDEIAAVARDYGAEVVRRPDALAQDTATSEAALLHALEILEGQRGYGPDRVVFLQCTSPLRRPGDIDGAVDAFQQTHADSLFSAFRFKKFIWHCDGDRLTPLNHDYTRRWREQDFPTQYEENGSIYVFKPSVLKAQNNRLGGKIAVYEMDYWSFLQIDEPEDFQLCEYIMTKLGDIWGR